MSPFHRKALAGVFAATAAVACTAFFSSPAEAASTGVAKVVGKSTVQFTAKSGKTNSLVITISGRTVTLDDKVALKAGAGCKAVKGDHTKVKCKTPKAAKKLNVALGDKNDTVTNKTSVPMYADGGSGNDTLNGGGGADRLQGGTGNDRLNGNGGSDTLLGGTGNDILHGGTGNDTINGNAGNDTVYGEAGGDSITGDAGNDAINGGDGSDIIDGGTGNDTISGAAGDDDIDGEAGNDTLYGAAGDDFLIGEDGADKIVAGDGDDGVSGDAGNDTIQSGTGDDFVVGGSGNDTIQAGAGDDFIVGDSGNDTITGDAGDDVLLGEGFDEMGNLVGSDTALDVVDGGDNVYGDTCLVYAAGTATNCEFTSLTPPVSATTSPSVRSLADAGAATNRAAKLAGLKTAADLAKAAAAK